jgi:hypothetical protein
MKALQTSAFRSLSADTEQADPARVTAKVAADPEWGSSAAWRQRRRNERANVDFKAMAKHSETSTAEESSTEKALRASPYCLEVKPTQGSQVWLVRTEKELSALKSSLKP